MLKKTVTFSVLILTVLIALSARADSARKLVSKGNAAYARGEYDEALKAYDEASVDMPESAHIYFNKGNAFYQKEEYDKAADAFEQAALKSKDIHLEADSKFNLGDVSFREAERQHDSDLKKALDACQRSIQYYQEALELVPDYQEAKENIEVVRLVMKSILDEIKKKEEEAKKEQEAKQNAADQIKQLIEKQQQLSEKNKTLSKERHDKGTTEGIRNKASALSDDQRTLGKETQDLAETLEQQRQKTNAPTPETKTEDHLKNAAQEQSQASEKLDKTQLDAARANQQKALEELENALKSLENSQDQQGQRQQQQQENHQQQQSTQDQAQEQQGQSQEQTAAMQLPDDAQNILDEEARNKQRRRLSAPGGYRQVDKDW